MRVKSKARNGGPKTIDELLGFKSDGRVRTVREIEEERRRLGLGLGTDVMTCKFGKDVNHGNG
jgi:hypothetical protein